MFEIHCYGDGDTIPSVWWFGFDGPVITYYRSESYYKAELMRHAVCMN